MSQIKVWLLEKTGLFIFFSTSSRISKAGSAVQDTKSASASFMFNLVNTSDRYFGSTLAKSTSYSKLKVLNDITLIFFLMRYSEIVLFTDSG